MNPLPPGLVCVYVELLFSILMPGMMYIPVLVLVYRTKDITSAIQHLYFVIAFLRITLGPEHKYRLYIKISPKWSLYFEPIVVLHFSRCIVSVSNIISIIVQAHDTRTSLLIVCSVSTDTECAPMSTSKK